MNLLFIFFTISFASGRIYERCELARELKFVHEAPPHQIATWVCIAEHESRYNTSAVGHLSGDGSGDHGIFQISDLYWCSPPGNGWACGLTCAQLEDENIEDDFICAKRIYREHKRLSGDGFNAWAVYQPYCHGNVEKYIEGCFDSTGGKPERTRLSTTAATTTTTTASTTTRKLSTTVRSSKKFNNDVGARFIFNGVKWPH